MRWILSYLGFHVMHFHSLWDAYVFYTLIEMQLFNLQLVSLRLAGLAKPVHGILIGLWHIRPRTAFASRTIQRGSLLAWVTIKSHAKQTRETGIQIQNSSKALAWKWPLYCFSLVHLPFISIHFFINHSFLQWNITYCYRCVLLLTHLSLLWRLMKRETLFMCS